MPPKAKSRLAPKAIRGFGQPADISPAEAEQVERAERERAAREQAEREQAEREQAAREQAAREQAAREQAAREQAAREQAAREQAEREQAEREQAAREQAAREQAAREQAAREQAAREQAAREQAAREQAAREQAAREQAAREQAAREQAAREQAAREQAEREQAAREQAEREQAAREQAEREELQATQAGRTPPTAAPAATPKVEREPAKIGTGRGLACREIKHSLLSATETTFEKFSIRLPEGLKRRLVARWNHERRVIRKQRLGALGENHIIDAALRQARRLRIEDAVTVAKLRKLNDAGVMPSHSTSIHPDTRELMFDLEGEMRAASRHGLYGHVVADLVEHFLDQLDREDPIVDSGNWR